MKKQNILAIERLEQITQISRVVGAVRETVSSINTVHIFNFKKISLELE